MNFQARSLVLFLVLYSSVSLAAGPVFQGQTRIGFTGTNDGDQWEPSIAADSFGHVYVLIPEYTNPQTPTIPGCASCPSPTMFLTSSSDNGSTWSAPRLIADPGTGQIDVQIKVDPADGKTVYASWLQDNKSVIAVAKSTDFGQTWKL